MLLTFFCFFFFFFQAEDGIRDLTVTGVQTCALPISLPSTASAWVWKPASVLRWPTLTSMVERICSRSRVYSACSRPDRKSTRLNSSHSQISYAVFCLKKKKNVHVQLGIVMYYES